MKKITVIIAIVITVLCCSCSSIKDDEFNTPTFKVASFEKTFSNGLYHCKEVIRITGIPEKYSIDGIIYANDITKIGIDIPQESYMYDIHEINEDESYFNIYGTHKGDITLELEWTSKDDLTNYLIGWHLTYGFGENCQVLMINLEQK